MWDPYSEICWKPQCIAKSAHVQRNVHSASMQKVLPRCRARMRSRFAVWFQEKQESIWEGEAFRRVLLRLKTWMKTKKSVFSSDVGMSWLCEHAQLLNFVP